MKLCEIRIAIGRKEHDHDRYTPFIMCATRPSVLEARNEIEREVVVGDVEYEYPRPLSVTKHRA